MSTKTINYKLIKPDSYDIYNVADNNSNLDTIDNELKLQSNRINNLATLKNGSTTGDAELIDIRLAYDGTTYTTAGEAVRREIEKVSESYNIANYEILNIKSCITNSTKHKNLFDKNNPLNIKGYFLDLNGNLIANENYATSNYIRVEGGKSYVYTGMLGGGAWCVYDRLGDIILSNHLNQSNVINVPEDGEYVRVSYHIGTDTMLEVGTVATEFEEYGAGISEQRTVVNIYADGDINNFYIKMLKAFTTGNCDVYIGKGDYIYTNELVDSIMSVRKRGIPVGNGCRYFFETGAKLVCEYTGSNAADVVDLFSPLDSWNRGGSWEIYNLDLVAKNTCYALHDESNGADEFYKRVYKNCWIELDNSALGNSSNTISKALGGGLGKHSEIIIEGCVFKATNPNGNGNAVSYHGANNSNFTDAKILVTNSWFEGNFRTSDLSGNTESPYPRMIYTGNSSKTPVGYPSTWDVKVWNNEVRG